MRLDLLGDEVALCDLDLFILGISGQADDLHAVQQRLRHVERVRRRHEHHVRQVVVDLQIVIVELGVLLRVQHLEQRRRRIATEILPKLVDLVQQEQRSDEHTSELQSLMRISYAVFCLNKKKHTCKYLSNTTTKHVTQHNQ